jgi:MFS family permease
MTSSHSDPYAPDGSYAWFRLAICILLSTLGGAGLWVIVVALPSVQADFGVDRADASLPYTATMIGFAAGNYLIGRWVDRTGILLPVLASALFLGSGFFLAALSPNIAIFSAAHGVLVGLGTSATFGPLLADLSHWFKKRRGAALAAMACGNYAAGVLWPFFVRWSLTFTDWRTTYMSIAGICIAAMVPLAFFLRRKPSVAVLPGTSTPAPGAELKQANLPPNVLQGLLVLAGLGCCVAMSMPQVHIVAYCVDLGFGLARGADMLAIMVGAGVVSRLASGFLADAIGGVKTLLLGSVLQCAALFLFLPFDGLVSLYLVSLVFGLSQGGIVPSYAIVVREYLPAKEAGQRVGLVIMATILGMALGGWMSGWIYDLTGSYQAAFLNGIGWNLMNIAIMVFILLRGRSRTGKFAAA